MRLSLNSNMEQGMWSDVVVAGVPVDLFLPEGPAPGSAVVFLHGHAGDTLRSHPTFTSELQQRRLAALCPHGGPCWWVDRPAGVFPGPSTPLKFIQEAIPEWTTEHLGIEPPHLALLGVSMGGQGALNIAYRNALRFPVVAALSPAIDFHLLHGRGYGVEVLFASAEEARQETAVLHLHPLNWPKHQFLASDPLDACWHSGLERLVSKLQSTGIPFTADLTTSAGGHGWPYFDAMAGTVMDFLEKSLTSVREAESSQR